MITELLGHMKFYKEIFLFMILIILSTESLFSQDCKAKVTINTNADSSLIFINNNFAGRGKVVTELAEGNYLITAEESSSLWDAKRISDSLNIADCSRPKYITLNFNKGFYLQTDPQDVSVYSKDSLIGFTPIFVPEYFNSLELKKPHYKDKILYSNKISPDEIVKLNYIGIPNGKSFFKKNLFKILMGGIIVLGSATAYFKLKADNRFSQYQDTGNDYYLTQTRKFDLISGITMGALEINLGVLLYYFLND